MRTRFYKDGELIGDVLGIHDVYSICPPDEPDGYTVEHYLHADDVRAEASRRMQALFGARNAEHLQIVIMNANREATRLLRKGSETWTSAEATRAAELEQADLMVEVLRAASNALEPNPPANYADDVNWPAFSHGI